MNNKKIPRKNAKLNKQNFRLLYKRIGERIYINSNDKFRLNIEEGKSRWNEEVVCLSDDPLVELK